MRQPRNRVERSETYYIKRRTTNTQERRESQLILYLQNLQQKMPSTTTNDNRAVWLESFDKHPYLVNLPVPEAVAGSVVVRPLATLATPYAKLAHAGKLPQLNLRLPLVPNPNSIARVHAVGPDAIQLRPGALVYVDATIRARDNPDVMIMQGHHGGEGEQGARLMQGAWRDGALQQFQRVPLENCYALDEARLLRGPAALTPPELASISMFAVAAGGLIEAAGLRAGETVVVGPSGGSFGGAAVELALASGANVIALGRSQAKLDAMARALGSPATLRLVAMTGDAAADAKAILRETPGGAGADIVNDWTPGAMETPPFLEAAVRALRSGGRVVLSGGASGAAAIPYAYMVHKNLTMSGKWMCSPETLKQTIAMITQGVLKVGRRDGSVVNVYPLEDFEAAFDNAEKEGGWRNYTIIAPNES